MRDGNAADRIGGRGEEYHGRVAAAFRRFAEREPDRFAVVDAEGSPEEVHARVTAAIDKALA